MNIPIVEFFIFMKNTREGKGVCQLHDGFNANKQQLVNSDFTPH